MNGASAGSTLRNAKHNFARLQSNVRKICRILEENGKKVDENQGFLALPNFYEWFHDDLFIYHSSVIAEFLNNIRWSIYRYLQPEFARSYTRVDPEPMYKFDVPAGCAEPLARDVLGLDESGSRATFHAGVYDFGFLQSAMKLRKHFQPSASASWSRRRTRP